MSYDYRSMAGWDTVLPYKANEYDIYMLKMQKMYCMRYFGNIYLMNRAALRIQHWFHRQKHAQLTVDTPKTPPKEITPLKERNKTRRERNAQHFQLNCAKNIHLRC